MSLSLFSTLWNMILQTNSPSKSICIFKAWRPLPLTCTGNKHTSWVLTLSINFVSNYIANDKVYISDHLALWLAILYMYILCTNSVYSYISVLNYQSSAPTGYISALLCINRPPHQSLPISTGHLSVTVVWWMAGLFDITEAFNNPGHHRRFNWTLNECGGYKKGGLVCQAFWCSVRVWFHSISICETHFGEDFLKPSHYQWL